MHLKEENTQQKRSDKALVENISFLFKVCGHLKVGDEDEDECVLKSRKVSSAQV